MKALIKVTVVAWLFVVGVMLIFNEFWIEAGEPQDVHATGSALDCMQETGPVDDSWADADIPVSAMSPSNGKFMERVRGERRSSPRLLVQTRNEILSEFHKKFLCEDERFVQFRFEDQRMVHRNVRNFYRRDVSRLLRGNFTRWDIVECANTIWIEPKRFLQDDEYQTNHIDPVSNKSRFFQFVNSSDSKNRADINDLSEDSAPSQAMSDPFIRLLEASNEQASRTEWKLVRSVKICLTDCAAPGPAVTRFAPSTRVIDELEELPLEELNSFERIAIDQLRSNPDQIVVVSETPEEIQLVGAVGQSGTLQGAISYRLERVALTSTDAYTDPREMRRPRTRWFNPTRREVFSNFHSKFEMAFTGIMDNFGYMRMWVYDSINTRHSVNGDNRSWFLIESSHGMRIEAKESLHGGDLDAVCPDIVSFKSTVFTFVPTWFPWSPDGTGNYYERFRRIGNCNLNPFSRCWSEPPSEEVLRQWYDMDLQIVSESRTEWKLDRLELIGLLKHDAPVSYTSHRVQNVKQLEKLPTAPLNSFEKRAIDRLRANWAENVVVSETESEIQLVGSLRATRNCLQCHTVTPNELLGALTYRLRRAVKAPDAMRNDSTNDKLPPVEPESLLMPADWDLP